MENVMEEFFAFRQTENVVKTQTLMKKLEKYLNTIESDKSQVLDAIRILKMYISELELDNFQASHYIVAPIIERLEYTKNWTFDDIRLASIIAGFGIDYATTHLFAQKIVTAMKSNPEKFDTWQPLTIYINAQNRLLYAKFCELDYTQNTPEIIEISTLFDQYTHLALEICSNHEQLEMYKVIMQIRSDIFHRNLTAVDDGLETLRDINKDVYTAICRDISIYNKYAGVDITRLQLQVQVGLQLRKLREKANLSQDEMSDIIGLSGASAIVHIECGKQAPHIHSLFLLVKKMNINIHQLLGLEE